MTRLITETVELGERTCAPDQMRPGNYAKISVSDTGIGMDEETREKVFDPFFSTKDKSRGTGLGLASAYGIIRNHGGLITVHSEVGQGSTFSIYLPISSHEAVMETNSIGTLVRGNETILLVDDEESVIEVIGDMLRKLGYRVIVARGGNEAVEAMKEGGQRIDLVILDLIMPGMDGAQTFEALRELQEDVSVLLSSGYAINAVAESILNRGCDGFIQKPFNIHQLSDSLRSVLDKKPMKPPTSNRREE